MNQRILKEGIIYPISFVVIYLLLTGLIVGVAIIPRERIKTNMLESAEYMCESPIQWLLTDWIHASQIDHYADCITLSIAYELDESRPLQSAMTTSFYGYQTTAMNTMLLESVRDDLSATTEYLRYWHGSAAAMRLLHLFWNIKTIYMFHAILMAALSLILIVFLFKNSLRAEAVTYVLAMIIVSVWYVPLCLEYSYTFICMMVASIVSVLLAVKQKNQWLGVFFMLTGMATVYFDFLTTESLSLLIPLLLILRVWSKQGGERKWISSLKFGMAWSFGYFGMWGMKWLTASIVLGENMMPYVTGHVAERISGGVTGYYMTGNTYIDTLLLNLRNLFPYEYGISGAVLVMVFVFVVAALPVVTGRVRLRKKVNLSDVLLFSVIGLFPYVRFLVLHNHSYIHNFFTYRAQAATIMAFCFIVLELVESTQRKAVSSDA